MKQCVAFVFYLVALLSYVTLTRDFWFLAVVVALFVGVAATTFFALIIVDRWRTSPEPRRRVANDNKGTALLSRSSERLPPEFTKG